jgi:septal ring factor EnvC (AmiA/AmiB activator)
MTVVARTVTFSLDAAATPGHEPGNPPSPAAWGLTLMLARHRTLIAAALLAAVAASAVVTGPPLAAQQQPGSERSQIRSSGALVSVNVDVLRAEDTEVSGALSDVRENVDNQKAALSEAQGALSAAQSNLQIAEAALADTQSRLSAINDQADAVVIDSFVSPPFESAIDALSAESTESATVKQSLLSMQADENAALLAQYMDLQSQLNTEKAAREEAKDAAESAQADADAAYADVQEAVGQQAAFAAEVERRIDQRLAEADNLEATDPALAEQIRGRVAELAAALNELDEEVQAERARQQAAELGAQAEINRNIAGPKPVPGGVTDVACPDGGTVQVAGDIAHQVERLLADADAAGFTMCGFGYRDPADQIAVRRANCGSSNYAIYQMPSSSCHPPTARPGTSMHEQGLAIDFTIGGSTIRSGSGASNWLRANAANYGLYNLPGEPWHYSLTGD